MLGKGAIARQVKVERTYGAKFVSHPTIEFTKVISYLLAKFEVTGDDLVPLSAATTTDELSKVLKELPTRTESQGKLFAHLEGEGSATKQTKDFIARKLPRFMYVSSYDRMDGTVQFNQIQALQNQNALDRDEHRGKKLFLEFLQYAGISLSELLKQNTYETYNALLQASLFQTRHVRLSQSRWLLPRRPWLWPDASPLPGLARQGAGVWRPNA